MLDNGFISRLVLNDKNRCVMLPMPILLGKLSGNSLLLTREKLIFANEIGSQPYGAGIQTLSSLTILSYNI